MAKKLYEESNIQAIADAIRGKNGTTTTYKPSEMATAIAAIEGGSVDTLDARLNGTLTSYSNDTLTEVLQYGFYKCEQLAYVNLPAVTTVGSNGFSNCSGLVSVSLPSLTYIGDYGFYRCTSLESIVIPSTCKQVQMKYVFYGCTSLKTVDIYGAPGQIEVQSFRNCSALEAVILRHTDGVIGVPTNGGFSNTYAGSGIVNGIGYIYVPAALMEDYKANTYWKAAADYFRAIEDYPDITGG